MDNIDNLDNKITFYEFNNNKRNSKLLLHVILIVTSIIFMLIGIYLVYLSSLKTITKSFNYKSIGEVNYTPYYNGEKVDYNTFVRSYLTGVDINFKYDSFYSTKVDGKVLYSVTAYWYAYNNGNKSEQIYKSNIENLTPLSEKNIKSQINYNNSVSTNLDYKKYVQKYLSYKANSQVSSQAMVVVEYKVNSTLKPNGMDNVSSDDTVTLEIPLSESTFKINSKTTAYGKMKTINKISTDNKIKNIKEITGIIFIILGIIDIISFLIIYIKESLSKSEYERKLSKIMNAYDNIIVDVDTMPDTNDKNIIEVKSFDELLDAQMQVGMPINFKEENFKAVFILVKNDMVWKYELSKK